MIYHQNWAPTALRPKKNDPARRARHFGRINSSGDPQGVEIWPFYWNIVQYYTILYNMIPYCTIWCHIVQYDAILYNMIPYCTIWYHIVHDTILYNMIPYMISYMFFPWPMYKRCAAKNNHRRLENKGELPTTSKWYLKYQKCILPIILAGRASVRGEMIWPKSSHHRTLTRGLHIIIIWGSLCK